MEETSSVRTNDGVALVARGDVVLIVYRAAARLHRTRWLFDELDRAAAESPGGVMAYMVILATADPPDAATRAENTARLQKLGPALSLLVTVPVGDVFWVSVVRTIMRAMHLVHGRSRSQAVMTTLEAGLDRLLEASGPKTPQRTQLEADLDALHAALGVKASWSPRRQAS